ncbi:MAG: PQQ-binding-like beta-propeller repeat protein [Thermogutta sp.]|nr:PQQ-binding-like beta-propeller repeat protein [Thermogutta sp.]HOP76586.1 PQQ-binding-like beta-propeller repeat protein [Thermogutta sp.]HPU05275.1 PQQ-binding-like beta-propeller repeat protein [Thermogutta sp.]
MIKVRMHIYLAALLVGACCGTWELAQGEDWPAFRGGLAAGVLCGGEDIPPVLSPENQLLWKAPLPGRGPSSPIVVKDKVIVTAAVGYRQNELHVLCFDAKTGKQEWDFRFWATGSTVCNPFGGVAASTPVSDGRRIVALFSSNDLVCLDMEGRPLWFRGLGFERPYLRNDVGMASSPVIEGDVVIVQAESLLDAIVCGLDLKTGQTVWLIDRPKQALWCTPLVVRCPSPSERTPETFVLLQSRKDFQAVCPYTGEVAFAYDHWCDTVSSAAAYGDLVALPAAGIHALRLSSSPARFEQLWISDRLRCGNTSPLVWNNKIYLVKSPNIFACADGKTGDILRQVRLGGSFWASPLLVGRYIYAVNYEGTVFVMALDDAGLPSLAGQWDLESGVLASPASDGRQLYFRTNQFLYAFRLGDSGKE